MSTPASHDALMSTRRTWSRCPVCDEGAQHLYVAFPELAFVRCSECGLIYKSFELPDARPAEFYEQTYFQGRKSGRDKRFEHRARKAMRWVRAAAQFTQAKSMLDVGCSLGYVIEGGRRLGLASAGMDISSYAVERCRERGYDARVGSLERFPFDDGAFDIVVMKHVLEHTPEPKQALAEVSRVLSSDGVVLIAVPDSTYWKGVLLRERYRYYRPDDLGQQHYIYYSDETLERLLSSSGFTVCARSKGLFREREARRGGLQRAYEVGRAGVLSTAFGLAKVLRLRRELFLVARRNRPY
jgi:SAM-dependent methyltransferase